MRADGLVKLMWAMDGTKTFPNSYSLYIPRASLGLDLHTPTYSRQRFARFPPVDPWPMVHNIGRCEWQQSSSSRSMLRVAIRALACHRAGLASMLELQSSVLYCTVMPFSLQVGTHPTVPPRL